MNFSFARIRILLLTASLLAFGALTTPVGAQQSKMTTSNEIDPRAVAQIQALEHDKSLRTPAQRKIGSHLLFFLRQLNGQPPAPGVPALRTGVQLDSSGRILVDIRANVTANLLSAIARSGGTVVGSFPQTHALRAQLRPEAVEPLAALPELWSIQPAVRAAAGGPVRTRGPLVPPARRPAGERSKVRGSAFPKSLLRPSLLGQEIFLHPGHSLFDFPTFPALNLMLPPPRRAKTGPIDSEGDTTHEANRARMMYGVDGTGVKVGVLSDGVKSLQTSISSGELPSNVTVLPGQAGPANGDEGTAMLEIVHDLAPGAQLYFATAFSSPDGFAQNIRDLRAAGCDIIVDDVGYFNEDPFQDDVISQAVSDVLASGALYFAFAGNAGNLDDRTSGVWEGDFVDGGAIGAPITDVDPQGRLHNFGSANFNRVTSTGYDGYSNLFWSDPLQNSDNDYDLFLLSSDGTTVIDAGVDLQDGSSPQDPYEFVALDDTNERLVIVQYSGVARYLHMDTGPVNGGQLQVATVGQTKGHSTIVGAMGVGATPAVGPFPNPFSSANVTENFSSDGPRRVFYQPDGTPLTPGNLLATGGTVRAKPDMTAADGVRTSVNGFDPFYGTSAAAPHAAAIAALIKSLTPRPTNAQTLTAMLSTAFDIEAAGIDRDSGVGIVDAKLAVGSLATPTPSSLTLNPTSVTGGASSIGTITLSSPAPLGGAIVTLASSNTGAATVPASVTVPAGSRTANFTITTVPVVVNTSSRIDASIGGVTQSATLQIFAPIVQSVTFAPNPVKGGQSVTGTVTLSGPAPAGDLTVTLTSSDTTIAPVPASVTVAAGQTTATFAITTGTVANTTDVTIGATLNGQTVTGTLTVFALGVASVSVNPATVRGGQASTGTVTLTDPAPAGGATVTLSASPTSAATVPASVIVAAGATTATFTISTRIVPAPTDVIVTATLNRVSRTAVLHVNPPTLSGLTLNPTAVLGGQISNGTVTLDGPAPSGGLIVVLSSSDPAVAGVPANVTVVAGRTSATFTFGTQPVASVTNVTISATFNGTTKTAVLRVAPPDTYQLTVTPSSVYGGTSSSGIVRLNGAAPTGGIVVTLSSSNSAVASPPATVTVPAGGTSANFTITTRGVTAYTAVTISASANGQTRTAPLNVAPNVLRYFTLDPPSVRGGVSSTGTVTLTGPAPAGGVTVTLSSANTAAAQTPTTVVVRAGQTSARFTVTTSVVASVQNVVLRAAFNGSVKMATLTVTPTSLSALSISPASVVGTVSATGLIRLDGPAPEGGLTVTLTSSNPSVAGVPTTVTVPAGLQTKSFTIVTSAVTTPTQVTITARFGSVTARATLTVTLPRLRTLTVLDAQGNLLMGSIAGGTSLIGKVEISNPAPTGGLVVQLSSDNAVVTVPASVTILAGQTTATFTIGTSRVAVETPVLLTATANGVSVTASLTLEPLMLVSLTLVPSTILGGNSALAVVSLNGPAPTGGVYVSLQTSDQTLTALPATVFIAAGASMTSVYVQTQPVGTSTDVTITASASVNGGNFATQTATLTIVPPTLLSLAVSPSGLRGGQSAQGTITLTGLSPGAQVTLTSSDPTIVQVPAAVFVPGGRTNTLFNVTTSRVTTATTVTITATYNGTTRTTTIRVNP